jgi:oxalate---CoA ligase
VDPTILQSEAQTTQSGRVYKPDDVDESADNQLFKRGQNYITATRTEETEYEKVQNSQALHGSIEGYSVQFTPADHLDQDFTTSASSIGNYAREPPSTDPPSISSDTQSQPAAPSNTLQQGRAKLEAAPSSKINVSQLRRENEMLRLVENSGGIINLQTKEFYDSHVSLLEAMANAGEPTSAPTGTRTDKRTAVAAFNNLEKRGKIKQIKTAVMTPTGAHRSACIVYLPDIEQEAINVFLAELARSHVLPQPGPMVRLEEELDYGIERTPNSRSALALRLLRTEEPGEDKKERWSRNVSRAEQLFSYDDATIRDVLLTERTTVAQMYGFIVGKAARLKSFHLSILNAFERNNASPNIVSHEHRLIDISFLVHDVPLGVYNTHISALAHSDELTQLMNTEEGRNTLVKDLPSSIHLQLQVGRSRARTRILDLLECLVVLGIATPLQESTSDAPHVLVIQSANQPRYFQSASLEGWGVSAPMTAPIYWHFSANAPVYLWGVSEANAPFWKQVPVGRSLDASEFWRLLEQASLHHHEIILPTDSTVLSQPDTIGVARSFRRASSWKSSYALTWHQMYYLKQFCDVSPITTPLDSGEEGVAKIDRISWVISAPRSVVEEYFATLRNKLLKDHAKIQKKSESRSVKRKKAFADKASLAQKAAEAKANREREWDAFLTRIHPDALEHAALTKVRRVRTRFIQASTVGDISKWEDEVFDALREADITSNVSFKPSRLRPSVTTAQTSVSFSFRKPPTVVNPPERPIRDLISSQGPALEDRESFKKRKRKRGGGSLMMFSRRF